MLNIGVKTYIKSLSKIYMIRQTAVLIYSWKPSIKNTGRFIMFTVITNIYNKKTKGPTLMEFFTTTGKLKKFFFDNQRCSICAPLVTRYTYSSCCHTRVNMLTRVWQQLQYRIDVCRVTRGAHIEHLQLSKKKKFQFSCGCEKFH